MKTKTIIITLIAMLAVTTLVFQSCKKDEETENKSPTCKITAPHNGQEFSKGESITISAEANDSDGNITEVRFFVDGVGKSSATSFPYNYEWNTHNESIGNHTIKCTGIDNNGGSTSDEISVAIIAGGTAPIANFTADITSGTAPLTVNFTDQSENNPTSWQWDFGDGKTITQSNPSHTYSADGPYTVSLTVSNEYGSDTKTNTGYIYVGSGGGGPDPTGYFTDPRDGQVYAFKNIGSQTWMAENLNYEIGNSGCYNNDPAYCDIYGRLYDLETIMNSESSSNTVPSGVQGICPDGWHLPSDAEWTVLTDYLGGESVAGGKMKEAGTAHWDSPNTGATNTSGFTAPPGGIRYSNGSFNYLGIGGFWSSSTEHSGTYAWYRSLYFDYGQVSRFYYYKAYGYSVRCLKN